MNWKFWTWAGQIRELKRENKRLQSELTVERAQHVATQLKHVVQLDQASRARPQHRHKGFI